MSTAEQFIKGNETYVKNLDETRKNLPLQQPARKVLIVTCMDARLLPAQALGLAEGDAFIVRNAGGRTAEAVRSILVAQQLGGIKEIAVFHHTDCGMTKFKDHDLREKLKANPPKKNASVTSAVESISFLTFGDLEQSVRDDVAFLKEHPLISEGSEITGWIHDVKDGKIKQVV